MVSFFIFLDFLLISKMITMRVMTRNTPTAVVHPTIDEKSLHIKFKR